MLPNRAAFPGHIRQIVERGLQNRLQAPIVDRASKFGCMHHAVRVPALITEQCPPAYDARSVNCAVIIHEPCQPPHLLNA
jgi:hypothetical protein